MTEDFKGPNARGFDWDHILDRHSERGGVARQSGIKTLFAGLTEEQIKARVRAAWRKRSRVKTQYGSLGAERIFYHGADAKSGEVIGFWYNLTTRIVETAFPVRQ